VLIDVGGKFTRRLLGEVVHKLWDLRAAGVAVEEIGSQIGWSESKVRSHIADHGGVRPRWGRDLVGRSLSHLEREEIMALRAAGCGVRAIARALNRSPCTISRELAK
jgi:IS30 family transposase